MSNSEFISKFLNNLIDKMHFFITLQYFKYVKFTNYLFINKFHYLFYIYISKKSCFKLSEKII